MVFQAKTSEVLILQKHGPQATVDRWLQRCRCSFDVSSRIRKILIGELLFIARYDYRYDTVPFQKKKTLQELLNDLSADILQWFQLERVLDMSTSYMRFTSSFWCQSRTKSFFLQNISGGWVAPIFPREFHHRIV